MSRKTHRSKSHRRRHTRRHTRKYHGGRGGMGGADLGHAFTTGASQTLYQSIGTPGLSSGGGKGNKNLAKRQAGKAAKLAKQAARLTQEAERANEHANRLEERAEAAVERAEEAAAQASRFRMRVNAPAFQPSQNLLNKLALNRGLSEKEAELIALLNSNNNYNENETKRGMRNQAKFLKKLMEN
jgi:hypothetical protein